MPTTAHHIESLCISLSLLLFLTLSAPMAVCQTDLEWTPVPMDQLTDWSDPGPWWKIEDDTIVAESAGKKGSPLFHYLIWNGSVPGDFELTLEYRIIAKEPQDAGVNFRVERPVGKGPNLPGYQAELDTANLYSEAVQKNRRLQIQQGKLFGHIHDGKRGRMFQRGVTMTIKPDGNEQSKPLSNSFDPTQVFVKPPDWNRCLIKAKGDQIQLYLNGILANELNDQDPKDKSTGDAIALQFRPSNSYRFEVRDLKYRPLAAK